MKRTIVRFGIHSALLLTMILCFGNLNAQTDVSITASAPSGTASLQVGANQASFSLTISNTGNTAFTANTITINQNAGVELLSASMGGSPLVVSGNIITVNADVPASGEIIVSYLKRAGCAVIPDATKDFFINIKDNVILKYTKQGSAMVKSYTTGSYPVLFPGFQFQTPASPDNTIAVEMNTSVSTSVPVKNAHGAGSTANMSFSITLSDIESLEITSLTVAGNKGKVNLPYTVNGKTITAALPAATLADVDTDGIFSADETLTFTPTYNVADYTDKVKADYALDFVAHGTTCQRFANATGIMYYAQEFPRPNINIVEQNVVLGNWCGKKFSAQYVITNTGTDNNSHYATNVFINPVLYNCQITNMSIGGTPIVPTANGYYFIPTGIDFNGDGIFSDFAPGQTVVVDFVALPNNFEGKMMDRVQAQFYLLYQTLNGVYKSNKNENYTGNSVNQFTLSGPGDVDGGKEATFNLSYNVSYAYADMASDILSNPSLIALNGNSEFDLRTSMVYRDNTGSQNIKLTPDCKNLDMSVKLALQTAGCNPAYIANTSPNTVVHCTIPGTGGACYKFETETVSASKTAINTCQSFNINAEGNLYHNDSDDCPQFTGIVAHIWDKNGIVPVSWEKAPMLSVGGTMYLGSNISTKEGVAYYFPVANLYGSGNPQTFDLVLDADMKVAGDHSLPDMTIANIRVEFSGYTTDSIYSNSEVRGTQLTVFDPEPSFSGNRITELCPTLYAHSALTPKTDGAGGVFLKKVTFSGAESHFSREIYDYIVNKPKVVDVNELLPSGSYISKTYSIAGYNITPGVYSGGTVTFVYDDFYGTSCQESKTIVKNVGDLSYDKSDIPQLMLLPTDQQQSIHTETSWNLAVENSGEFANNVALRLQPDASNEMLITITRVKVNGTEQSLTKDGNTVLVNIGSVATNGHTDIEISAIYKKCTNTGISKINVEAVYGCEDITFANYKYYKSTATSTELKLENMVAILNATETFSNKYYSLCQPIPIHVDLDNIGRADLVNLGMWFNSLENFEVENNEVVINGKPIAVTTLKDNAVISSDVLSPKGLENPLTPMPGNAPTVSIDFNVKLGCGNIPNVVFNIGAQSNCQDVQQKTFTYIPNVRGYENLVDLVASGSGGIFATNQGTSVIKMSVSNTSSNQVDSAYISATLPAGISYVSYTPYPGTTVLAGSPIISPQPDGSTVIEWELSKRSHLKPGETVGVTVTVKDTKVCPPLASSVLVHGKLERSMKDCFGNTCLTNQKTEPFVLDLVRPSASFDVVLSGNDAVCSPANETYIVSTASGVSNLIWGISPAEAGTITGTDANARTQFAADFAGTATVYAYATGVCGTDTATVEVVVTKKPEVNFTCDNLDFSSTSINLSGGTPFGGTYSGPGVANGFLDLTKKPATELDKIVYTYTNAAGCVGKDSCIYEIPCDPSVFISAKKDICLGDTIELYVNADGLTEHCLYESYVFASTFDSLKLIDYSAEGTVEPLQVFMEHSMGPLTMLVSRLMGTFYPGSGKLVKIRLLASKAGDYTIDLMNFQFGGNKYPVAPFTIHVHEKPSITINSIKLCEGQNAEMIPQSNTPAPYVWKLPNLNTISASKITVSEAGVYHVAATDQYGCTSSDTANVTVLALPTVSVSDTGFCAGSDVTLTASVSAGANVVWNTGSTNLSIDVDVAGKYSVVATNPNGCSAQDSAIVSEYDLPTVEVEDSTICSNGSYTITAVVSDNVTSYLWNTGSTEPSLTVTEKGDYIVEVSTDNGCTATDTATISNYALPTAKISASDICLGDTLLIKLNIDGLENGCVYESYIFASTFAGLNVIEYNVVESVDDLQQITVKEMGPLKMVISRLMGTFFVKSGDMLIIKALPVTAGDFNISFDKFTFGNIGTLTINPITVTVHANPTITINSDAICAGGKHTFKPVTSESGPYSWMLPNETVIVADSLVANTSGIYTVSVTNSNGCLASDTATLTVNQKPTVQLADTAFCAQGSVKLTALTPASNVSFAWSNGQTTNPINVSASGKYSVTITNQFGCTATDSAIVTEYALPEIDIADTTICFGSDALRIDAGIFSSYVWSTGATTRYEDFDTDGEYSVAVTDTNGCSASDKFIFAVADSIKFTLDTVYHICLNTELTLTEVGFTTYAWNGVDGSDTYVFKGATEAGSVAVALTVTNEFGCSAVHTVRIDVQPLPVITLPETDTVCSGADYTVEIPETAYGYVWSNGIVGSTATINAGEFFVTATDQYGCSVSDTITIVERVAVNVTVAPGDTAFCEGERATLHAIAEYCKECAFVWNTVAYVDSIVVDQSGFYIVTATDTYGCTAKDSATVQVNEGVTLANDTIHECLVDVLILEPDTYSSYSWDNGTTEAQRSVDTAGNYSVEVIFVSSFGCSDTATIFYVVTSAPKIDMDDTFTCISKESDSLQYELPTLLAGPVGTGLSYLWSTGETTNEITTPIWSDRDSADINVSDSAYFSVTVTDENGCQTTDSALVKIHRFYYGDMDQSGPIQGFEKDGIDRDIMVDIFNHNSYIPRLGNYAPLAAFEPNEDNTEFTFQRTEKTPSVIVSGCWEFQANVDNQAGLMYSDVYAVDDYIFVATYPEFAALYFPNYGGWPVLANVTDIRNGRLKSDFVGYGSEAMNVSFKEGQIILSSNLPLRGLDVNLDDSTFKNVTFSVPTDLSGIASSPMMNSDQIWFQWQGSSFNTVITENTIGLNYTGKLPDTMVFSINYSYYVNSNMISTTDVITVILPSEEPGTDPTPEEEIPLSIFNSQSATVSLQPVPAHNELMVKSNFDMDYLVVFDKLGRKLIVQSSIGSENSTIDLTQLSQGVYQLQVFGKNGELIQESFTKL